jgi:uncharacterized alpha-E superfamily protein
MKRDGKTISLELDAMTARHLVRLAETWGVSVEEAMRRTVEQAHAARSSLSKERWFEAFKELQRSLNLNSAKAAEWRDATREARR